MIIYIMILHLKEKGHTIEIKTAITGDEFNLVTMVFVNDKDFLTLDKRTNSRWYEVMQQH